MINRLFRILLPVFLLISLAHAHHSAQPGSINEVLEQLGKVRTIAQVRISPEGRHVAWTVNGNGSRSEGGIYIAAVGEHGGKKLAPSLCEQACTQRDLAWSPDSRRLAFLSDAEKKDQEQVYVVDVPGGKARKLTSVTGDLSDLRWSPDGQQIAFLFIENAPRAAGPLMPMTPPSGVIESQVFEQRLAVVSVGGGEVKQVSPADMYIYEYDWAPDGKQFAMTAAKGEGDANWWIAQLYTMPAAGGEMRSILKPKLQICYPRWSPDGKSIAYISGIMSDEGLNGGDLYVIPSSGGEPRNLTPEIKASPSSFQWTGNGRIVFAENIDGAGGVGAVEVSGGRVTQLWNGPESMTSGGNFFGMGISLANDGKTSAVIRQSAERAPEVWAGEIGKWSQVTSLNKDAKPLWGKSQSVHWKNGDTQVQGWLIYPRDYDAQKKYPMVVVAHGGPAFAATPAWPSKSQPWAVLPARGYFVFYPNPRGSFGQGEAFTQGNVKDFGYGDLKDILTGVDEVEKEAPIDDKRVGITGWSYGGYMTMFAVTQTDRFRAGVAGAGVANWQSYYGENDIDTWMLPYFGASVYDDPEVYARSSPITFIKKTRTPTLVLVGDRDGEVPSPQSFEFWHALKTLGVETQLVVYPNEGHLFQNPEHQMDVARRLVQWFDDHMKPGNGLRSESLSH